MESTKEYIKLFNACPIKVGDTVRVLRGWKDAEYGYVCGYDYDNPELPHPHFDKDYIVENKYEDWYRINIPNENGDNIWDVPFFVLEVVKSAPINTATFDDYLAFHNASGLKVGDSVRVVRKAEDREMGWSDIWSGHMDDFVDRTYKITGDAASYGWELDNKWSFPTFVLQKVDEPTKKEEVKYVPEEILVKENSVVVNGCELTKEQIGALHYKLFRKGKKRVKKTGEVKHKAHNPNNLTPEQYGAVEGYRLLYADEIIERKQRYKEIEAWDDYAWIDMCFKGSSSSDTYRTKLSRKELAKLK